MAENNDSKEILAAGGAALLACIGCALMIAIPLLGLAAIIWVIFK